ncbi:hypothetical protein GCM10009665_57450 [Kitasatospora nipponensis]|uniref:Protein-L-isoaspartate O-methyltransferase n=1 Tax=Kitasatospora nipponensis TaxID=258049 RepID=A0ABP4HCV1_9ACTN
MSTDRVNVDLGVDARRALVDRLTAAGVLGAGWGAAFEAVPRHLFLPPVNWEFVEGRAVVRDRAADPQAWLAGAYRDTPAITQWDDGDQAGGQRDFTSSLSMPTMVALMLRDLDVEQGQRVREVGTGPGFNAALLAHRLGADHVVSVEIDKAVADLARANLAAAGLGGVRVLVGDGADAAMGWGGRADRLIATCSSLVTDVPVAWLDQTAPGGLIVAPTATLFGGGAIPRLQCADGGRSASGRFTGSSDFMRMRQQRYLAPPVDAYLPGDWPGDARQSTTDPGPGGHRRLLARPVRPRHPPAGPLLPARALRADGDVVVLRHRGHLLGDGRLRARRRRVRRAPERAATPVGRDPRRLERLAAGRATRLRAVRADRDRRRRAHGVARRPGPPLEPTCTLTSRTPRPGDPSRGGAGGGGRAARL